MYDSLMKRNKKASFPPYDLFHSHIYQMPEKCVYCHREFNGEWAKCHLEHAVPLSRGGGVFDFSNLRLSCDNCNMIKGVLREDEFLLLTGGNLKAFYEFYPYGKKPFWLRDGYRGWTNWKRR